MNNFFKYFFLIVFILLTKVNSYAFERNIHYELRNLINVATTKSNLQNDNCLIKTVERIPQIKDTIRNYINTNTGIKSNVTDDPTVDFTFTNDNSCSGAPIIFTSTVTGGKNPFKYSWDFGDGGTSTDENPTHPFNSLGCGTASFAVKLTVTDADDISAVAEKTIEVKEKPDISFSDKDDEFGNNPFNNCDNASNENPEYSITVNNDSKSTCVESYSIDWGDGSSTPDAKFPADHTYNLGAFNMVIKAKGSNGCYNDVLFIVKNQTNPSGSLFNPGNTIRLCSPTEPLEFSIVGWGPHSPGTRYEIDYGDDSGIVTLYHDDMVKTPNYNAADPSASTDYPVPHSYNKTNCPENFFTAVLSITNACTEIPSGSDVYPITVFSVPEADFIAPSSCVNTSITFTNKTIAGYNSDCTQEAKYTWDFGDGSPILEIKNSLPEDASTTHTYTATGVYNVVLTAKNSSCGETSKTKQVTISEAPTAIMSGGAEVCLGDTPPIITFTGVDSNQPYTFTYKINNGSSKTVKTEAGNNSVTIEAPTNVAGTFTYSLVRVSASSCSQSQTGTVVIIVNSAPTATISGTTEVCLDDPEPDITFTGANGTAPYTFTYNIDGGPNQTITTITGNSVTVKAPTNTTGVYLYNLVGVKDDGSGDCSMTPTGSAIITINDKPSPPVALVDQEYCNGEITSTISFSNNEPVSIFKWTNSNSSIGLPSSGTGNIQPFTAKNSTTGSITSTVTVIASVDGCESESETFTITVFPSASVDFSEPNQTICSRETTTKVLLSSTSPGADLSWSIVQPVGITPNIPLSGTNTIESETLTNTTDDPISIVYKAKATLSGTTQCPGVEYNYTITIYPKPEVTDNYKDTICSGTSFSISPKNGGGNIVPSGTKYIWGKPVINPLGSITGAIEEITPQPIISQTLGNTTSVIGTVTYSVTPLINDCPGDPFEIIIYVISSAVIDPIDNITLCSGDINKEIDLGNPPDGTRFKWSTDNKSIGLPGFFGYDKIPVFTVVNNGSSPNVGNITVESESIGSSDCGVQPVLFSITVNARPEVAGNMTDTICTGVTLNVSPKNGGGSVIPAGTKYTWSNPKIDPPGAIIGANEETTPQSIISQTLINTSDLIATATYTVIPTTNNCTGSSFDLTVYVIPGATLLPISDITLCDEEVNPEIDFGIPPEGVVYRWTTDNMDIGLLDFSGIGNIPTFTAVNKGKSPITTTIIVTPEGDFGSSDCGGIPIQFTITVNPKGQVDNPGNITQCSGENISINYITQNTGGSTTFEWVSSNANIGLESSGIGNISFEATNTGDTPMIATIIVTPILANNGVNCMGTSEQFTITVNPIPTVDQPENQSVCNGSRTAEIIFTGKIPNTIYSWSINDTIIGFPASGTGYIPETEVVNNQSDSIVAIITVVPSFNGCDGTPKDFKIVVYPSAVILKQPSSSTICLGSQPVTLSVIHTTGVKPPTYQWYSNTTNSMIGGIIIENETDFKFDPPYEYANTKFYYCLITFSNGGCGNLATDIAKVAINPNPIVILNNEQISEGEELIICEGDSIQINASGASSYTWNSGILADSLLLRDIGDYRVIGISELGCMDTFNFSVSYFDLMNYTIQSDKTEITNDQNQLHLWSEDIPTSYYTWDFGDGQIGHGSSFYHTYDIYQDGYFEVALEIINPYGCVERATKKIWVSLESFPNTFTPNGDGINDYFMNGWKIEIYNRNGILFYEGEEGWDGNYKGRPVANDTYFVVIFDSSEYGTTYKTNYVTILR